VTSILAGSAMGVSKMGEVVAVSVLIPGAQVSMSGDVVRIEMAGRVRCFDAVKVKEVASRSSQKERFRPLLSIPHDAKHAVILVQCSMRFEGDFTPRTLGLIRQGAHYSTNLERDPSLPDHFGQTELRCDMVRVLRESADGAILLGVLSTIMEDKKEDSDSSVVAMVDLLGFSHIMATLSLDDVERRYADTLMSGLNLAGLCSGGAFVLNEEGALDSGQDLWPVSIGVFQDTVVLYPKSGMNDRPLTTICEAVALLIDIALQGDWLFRGGIEFGTFRAIPEYNAYLGTGLLEAHRIETSQNWAGAAVGERAVASYAGDIASLKSRHLLLDYPVPLQRESVRPGGVVLAVNWCYFDLKWQARRRDKLEKLLEAAPIGAKEKVQATIDFHDHVVGSHLADLETIRRPGFGDPSRSNT